MYLRIRVSPGLAGEIVFLQFAGIAELTGFYSSASNNNKTVLDMNTAPLCRGTIHTNAKCIESETNLRGLYYYVEV